MASCPPNRNAPLALPSSWLALKATATPGSHLPTASNTELPPKRRAAASPVSTERPKKPKITSGMEKRTMKPVSQWAPTQSQLKRTTEVVVISSSPASAQSISKKDKGKGKERESEGVKETKMLSRESLATPKASRATRKDRIPTFSSASSLPPPSQASRDVSPTPRATRTRLLEKRTKSPSLPPSTPGDDDDDDEPPILLSELRGVQLYLLRPESLVSTTCAALTPIPWAGSLELDRGAKWRLRKETLTYGGVTSDFWVQGRGWPVKRVEVCGWLVGVDWKVKGDSKKFVKFYVDDGTGVLQCELLVNLTSRLPGDPPSNVAPKVEKTLTKGKSKATNASAYRRPPSPPPAVASTRIPEPNPDRDPHFLHYSRLEDYYTSIPIGTLLRLSGTVTTFYENLILHVDNVMIGLEDNEEPRFRLEVSRERRERYGGCFRLGKVWPGWEEAVGAKKGKKEEHGGASDDTSSNCNSHGRSDASGDARGRKSSRLIRPSEVRSSELHLSTLTIWICHTLTMHASATAIPLSDGLCITKSISEPALSFGAIHRDQRLSELAERIVRREDGLMKLKKGQGKVKAKPKALIQPNRGTAKPALPPCQLEGADLQAKVTKLFERAVQGLVRDGALLLTFPSGVAHNQDYYCLPTWRCLAYPVLEVIRTLPLLEGEKGVSTENVWEALKGRDEMWDCVQEEDVEKAVHILDELDEIMGVGNDLWLACS